MGEGSLATLLEVSLAVAQDFNAYVMRPEVGFSVFVPISYDCQPVWCGIYHN